MTDVEYILVGTAIGLLSGLFGVGGSSVSTPVLRLALGVSPLIALATPLPVALPAAAAGGYVYASRGYVHWRVVLVCGLAGVPAVIAGALATAVIQGSALLVLTGVFVTIVGLRLLRTRELAHHEEHLHESVWLVAAIGVAVGFLSGLLANGGGFLLMPAFVIVLGMTTHEAAGTSLIAVVAFAIPGTVVHWSLGHIDVRLMLLLSAGVIPASYLGGRIGIVLPPRVARLSFGLFLTLFGVFFGVKELVAVL
ncbi:MAG: sulfite exporter TauE/SafE family protein [Dehalococcoidia bacterium]|nr:MAG: sulfite exporter TauE/SafE family protein [Dehalococcoidia bacterium]